MLYVTYNLAYNGTVSQNPPNSSFPAGLSIDGNRTDGMCSRTTGRNSYIQVDTGYMSVITTVYLTFAGKINSCGSCFISIRIIITLFCCGLAMVIF